jgi:hypothetical protein
MTPLLQKAKLTSSFLALSNFGSKHRSLPEIAKMSTDEKEGIKHKHPAVHATPLPSPAGSTPPSNAPTDVDDAWRFLDANRQATADVPDEGIDIKRIRRKVDLRIVPLAFCLYILQFTDKLVLNVSLHSSTPGVSE